MERKLNFKEIIMVASMLFGMFFGAGNLIFPIHMGQEAGFNVWAAFIGFIVTGAGLPLLSVVAFGRSRSLSVMEMANRVDKRYSTFFACAMYLTIGPLFAIPRCATVSYTVGLEPMLGSNALALGIFSAVFFAIVLYFSLRPGRIIDWIGKYLNPAFLLFFCSLIIIGLLNPMGSIANALPSANYTSGAFFKGFLEGYNTMDALAGLAFGIVVINTVMGLGVKDADHVSWATAKAGVVACLMMALIYGGACILGAQSRGVFATSANGGIALRQICGYYFGSAGQTFLAITVTLACLKTSIGLVTSISEAFEKLFSEKMSYVQWAIGFTAFSFVVANVGLSMIIKAAIPVLMFLYPLVMTLIICAITGNAFDHDRRVYAAVTLCTLPAAFLDMLSAAGVKVGLTAYLPFYNLGMGWLVPCIVGFGIGLVLHKTK